MIHQLRIYEIFEHNRSAFLARFEGQAAPIMARHGFRLLGAWEARTATRCEFVYLLAWPDEAARDAAWTAFRADPEWIEAKRATREASGTLVGAIEDRTLLPAGVLAGSLA